MSNVEAEKVNEDLPASPESGDTGSDGPRIKTTCENCVRAKTKCSGPPGPCERCSGWRRLDCVFISERKRGRPRLPEEQKRTQTSKQTKQTEDDDGHDASQVAAPVPKGTRTRSSAGAAMGRVGRRVTLENAHLACVTTDCWTKISSANESGSGTVTGMAISPQVGLSFEQSRVVEIFFALYKNHASSRSCCQAWFSRQLNKIAAMLKDAQSANALISLVEWMNRHKLMVDTVKPPERNAFHDPDSGYLLPPMTACKGPMLSDNLIVRGGGSAAESNQDVSTTSPTCACIRLEYTRDEICSVKTSSRFVEIFGHDAAYFTQYLDTLYGGILPWGADVFANILVWTSDVILLIRLLAYRFMEQPRMTDATPVTRRVQSAHLFPCVRADGTKIDCVIRMDHVEVVSYKGVDVQITASFEPYTLPPPMACDFSTPSTNNRGAKPPTPLSSSLLEHKEEYESMGVPPPIDDDMPMMVGGASDFGDAWLEDMLLWVDEKEMSRSRSDQGDTA